MFWINRRCASAAHLQMPSPNRLRSPRPRSALATSATAQEHDADELVILTITHEFETRVRSYELVAQAFQ